MKQFIITSILLLLAIVAESQVVTAIRSYKTLTESSYKVADIILAPQIWFEASGCDVIPESKDSVRVIADFISKHPGFIIEIGVHTEVKEATEAAEEYIKISKCQAKAVFRCLTKELGGAKGSVEYKGYGGSEPVVSEELIRTSPMHREYLNQRNRRVELKILYVK